MRASTSSYSHGSAANIAVAEAPRVISGSCRRLGHRYTRCPYPQFSLSDARTQNIVQAAVTTTNHDHAHAQRGPTMSREEHSHGVAAATSHQPGAPNGVTGVIMEPDTLPVMTCKTVQLGMQSSLSEAVAALRAAAVQVRDAHRQFASGVVRVEAHIPRGTTALRWLMGQQQPGNVAKEAQVLAPYIYFSGRHSSAPDTPLASRAEKATKGWAAVAGAGAAWVWQGESGAGFDAGVVRQMQRFLSADQPRVRVLGGTRFDPIGAPSVEWAPLGAYIFALPLLEYSEMEAGIAVLAITLAWDSTIRTTAGSSPAVISTADSTLLATPVTGRGAQEVHAACDAVLAALDAMQPASQPSAPALHLEHVGALQHCPDEAGWTQLLGDALAKLEAVKDARAPRGLASLDLGLAREEFLANGQQGLDGLLAALQGAGGTSSLRAASANSHAEVEQDGVSGLGDPDKSEGAPQGLSKLVLARRSTLHVMGELQALWVLEALQERDPRAYQLYISDGRGTCFVGCTPERLYARSGRFVASEAVAGTRPRGPPGDVERDFWLSLDLLNSPKDHVEFSLVRDWIRDSLSHCAVRVEVEVPKSVLKQGALQHLYGRLAAELRPGVNDAHILAALHPTPAVCGRPREAALASLRASEPFDRGYYSGPFGWVSGSGAEFAVAIRSALIAPGQELSAAPAAVPSVPISTRHTVHLYAGVGVVCGSEAASEWQELDLKTRPLRSLLAPQPASPLAAAAPNVSIAWAALLVEELCRQGINMFCVAPGSRSSPLTAAIASHPRARLNIGIDERSLGFWALGYGRATGRPAVVVTSSGTAVANLLPSVVEAGCAEVPMLLITADRPAELRDTGANQTIDQIKIFGSYTRWFSDVAAPVADGSVPGRVILTTADTAVRYSSGVGGMPPGPVHLNMQFREPLAPVQAPWDSKKFMSGLARWAAAPYAPYTANADIAIQATVPTAQPTAQLADVLGLLRQCNTEVLGAPRGLLVLGELLRPEDVVGALKLAAALGPSWPVVTDVLSGLRLASAGKSGAAVPCSLVHHMDHILLLGQPLWKELRPDVIVQVGPRLTSKRLTQFLEWSASDAEGGGVPAHWAFVGGGATRHDGAHLVTHRVTATPESLAAAYRGLHPLATSSQPRYTALLQALDGAVSAEVDAALAVMPQVSEPQVARQLSRQLPPGHALFLGNSMPIRDMEMYACPAAVPGASAASITGSNGAGLPVVSGVVPVSANRGASGIDGVVSTAAGWAEGMERPTTLVIGDLSFLHDINGLGLLRSGEARPPLTIVCINNSGGGIFHFLPIASAVPVDTFTPLWATPQNVDLEGMCRAHGIPHQRVAGAPSGLQSALAAAWGLNRHSVIEVITERTSNVEVHRTIQAAVARAVRTTMRLVSIPHSPVSTASAQLEGSGNLFRQGSTGMAQGWVEGITSQRFSLPLAKPLTTATGASHSVREGVLLTLQLRAPDGSVHMGRGEVSPLPGLHRESLEMAAAQVACLSELLRGVPFPMTAAALLGGRLSTWLKSVCGIDTEVIAPSVRFGLESALLDAASHFCAPSSGHVLLEAIQPASQPAAGTTSQQHTVLVSGLISAASQADAVNSALQLYASGYTCIKIKIARRGSTPLQDAELVCAVRAALGPSVVLRADANQGWSLDEAITFGGAAVTGQADLEYVEQPCVAIEDCVVFFQQTGVKFALDEGVDEAVLRAQAAHASRSSSHHQQSAPESHWITQFGPAPVSNDYEGANVLDAVKSMLSKASQGLAALVLKPSVLGGCEPTLQIAAAAHAASVKVVISSSFESPTGMSTLVALSAAVDSMAAQHSHFGSAMRTHHGLGTLSWFQPLGSTCWDTSLPANSSTYTWHPTQAAVADVPSSPTPRHLHTLVPASSLRPAVNVHALHLASPPINHAPSQRPVVVFIHGFLGTAADWMPMMHALLATGHECMALDLPGHGATSCGSGRADETPDITGAADAVVAFLQAHGLTGRAVLVGYSLGARVAMRVATTQPSLLSACMLISGTPGIKDLAQATWRKEADDRLADMLEGDGLAGFLAHWYSTGMWSTLRRHPAYPNLLQQRMSSTSANSRSAARHLAAALRAMSTGRMPHMWTLLQHVGIPMRLVVGQLDSKYVTINTHMVKVAGSNADLELTIVPQCGHAVHVEQPLAVVNSLVKLLHDLQDRNSACSVQPSE